MSNSTNEPDDFSEDSSERPERRRTIWIWIIFAWTLLGALIGIPSIWLMSYDTISPQLGVPAPQIGIDFKILNTLVMVINLAAAWALIMLRSRAVKLFAIGLVMAIVTNAYAGSAWWALVGGFIYYPIVLLYLMRLRRRGVLL